MTSLLDVGRAVCANSNLQGSNRQILEAVADVGGRGHQGWEAVFDDERVVSVIADVYRSDPSPPVRALSQSMLLKAYGDHFDHGGQHAATIKNSAVSALIDVNGASVMREILRDSDAFDLADQVFLHAHYEIGHPMVRATKGAPSLEVMRVTGANVRLMVVDCNESHAAPVRNLAVPFTSQAEGHYHRIPPNEGGWTPRGPGFFRAMHTALDDAWAKGIDVLVISNGINWDSEPDRELYVQEHNGNWDAARAHYDEDLSHLTRRIDVFPGLLVVAAGNSGWLWKNDLALSPTVLVGGSLVPSEKHAHDSSSNAHHSECLLGVGTQAFAGDELVSQATSWAAPQLGDFAARVIQAGRWFGSSLSNWEVKHALWHTAERPIGSIPRADSVTAVRYGKLLGHLKAVGDEAGQQRLLSLPIELVAETVERAWPLLDQPDGSTHAKIQSLLGTS